MTNIFFIINIMIVIFIFYYIVTNIKYIKQNYHFLLEKCKQGICYKNMHKCYSINGYIYSDNDNESCDKIERKTLKCVLEPEDKYKLLNLENIFVPSMMNGTFCDILYTTYYDYTDFAILKNRVYNLNMPLSKCIRIRKYYFQPNIYFEIKYTGGTKIRALIDENYNLLEPDKVDEENKEMIISILDKIKSNKVNPIFKNSYKRMSFIYKNNPSLRITIDSNIEFFHNNIYDIMDKDILEFKIPVGLSMDIVNQYIDEIRSLSGVNLKFQKFSKFEYYYYKVIMDQTY